MAETSFPLVGADLTDPAWAQTVGAVGNGIIDDWGNPYAITLNTNDTITIRPSSVGPARAVVNGFGHSMDTAKTLTIPAVTSRTQYNVGLLYDPKNAALPVSLVVLKGTTVPLTTGQKFLPVFIIVRNSGQTLAAATLFSPKPRLRNTLYMGSETDLLQLDPPLFLYGTEVALSNGKRYVAKGSLANPVWEMQAGSDWVDFSASYSGVTGGKTSFAKKRLTPGLAEVMVEFVLSSSSRVTNPMLNLPAPPASWIGGAWPLGDVQLWDVDGSRFDGIATLSGTAARAVYLGGGPPAWELGVTATSPFRWTTNDRIRFLLRYPID